MKIIRNTEKRRRRVLCVEDGYGTCVKCGGDADAISRHGEFISAGYDSDYDAKTFAIVKPVSFPEGRLCDACVHPLVEDGTLEHVYSFGQQQKRLSAEAYAVIFRSGQSAVRREFAEMTRKTGDKDVSAFLQKVVALRQCEPRIAGMLTGLLAEIGINVSGADTAYTTALADEENLEDELLQAMFDEMQKMDSKPEAGAADT